MNLVHQRLALSLVLAAAATNRIFCRELLLFLMAVTCISGVTALNCHLLTGELTLLSGDAGLLVPGSHVVSDTVSY